MKAISYYKYKQRCKKIYRGRERCRKTLEELADYNRIHFNWDSPFIPSMNAQQDPRVRAGNRLAIKTLQISVDLLRLLMHTEQEYMRVSHE